VHSWNPQKEARGEYINYIDLSSIDNETKIISAHQRVLADDAPSRARQLVQTGDILVSTVRPYLNGVARVPQRLVGATASTGFCVLRPNTKKVSPEYLFQWLDGRDGRLLVRCWGGGCDPRDILAELRRLGLIDRSCDAIRPAMVAARSNNLADAERRIALARRIWGRTGNACGGPVAAYLAGRGITIAPPESLRMAPSLRRLDGTYQPAMVARVDDVNGCLIGIHRTWLELLPDGGWQRHDRASLGPISGGAVRLAPAAETLLVAEGIESGMAATQATAQPTWAALSAGGIERLILPPLARQIIILADNDVSGTGERAAYRAADRWLGEGRRVRIAMPPEPDTDFNDVLAGRIRARIAESSNVAV
jgi:hypothetical protein